VKNTNYEALLYVIFSNLPFLPIKFMFRAWLNIFMVKSSTWEADVGVSGQEILPPVVEPMSARVLSEQLRFAEPVQI